MKKNHTLHKTMTPTQFENGYWYAVELKSFAREIGIPNSSKLRKDELEALIKTFLNTQEINNSNRKNIDPKQITDSELGLSLTLPIIHFKNNSETWSFIESEAKKLKPDFVRHSGSKYRLNRWREDQLTQENQITYEDLTRAYIKLNESNDSSKRIKGTYYIYFISDYFKYEENATRKEAIKAWHQLKLLNLPKTYKAWRKNETR